MAEITSPGMILNHIPVRFESNRKNSVKYPKLSFHEVRNGNLSKYIYIYIILLYIGSKQGGKDELWSRYTEF